MRAASLSDSRWSRISAGKASSNLSGARLSRGFGLSAGAEVAGSASLTRSHAVLRMQPAHLSAAVQIPTFFGRPLRLAGKAGAERPSPGEMSCPRPNRQRQGSPKLTEGLGNIRSHLLRIGAQCPITFHIGSPIFPMNSMTDFVCFCHFSGYYPPLPGGPSPAGARACPGIRWLGARIKPPLRSGLSLGRHLSPRPKRT